MSIAPSVRSGAAGHPRSGRLQLLVSVRDAAEAQVAIDAGADRIDVKEPERGALGRADDEQWAAVVRQVAGRRPVSVALGELHQLPADWQPPANALQGVGLVKVGLGRCHLAGDWPGRLAELARRLGPATGLVAVHYADWRTCGAPPPTQLLQAADRAGCQALLVDTCDKQCGTLQEHVDWTELRQLLAAARARRLMSVVAGSVTAELFEQLQQAGAEVIAVRGAACRNGCRTAHICAHQVRKLRSTLDQLIRS